jgi:hypothetical protein
MSAKTKYCLIRDIEGLLKNTFINKHDVVVWKNKILNDRAIDHLDGPIEMYCSLPERTEKYLETKGTWVGEKELRRKIAPFDFDKEHVDYLFDEYLEHHGCIGAVYQMKSKNAYEEQLLPGYVGKIYKWHPMTPAEIARNKEALDAFDAL